MPDSALLPGSAHCLYASPGHWSCLVIGLAIEIGEKKDRKVKSEHYEIQVMTAT